MQLSVSCAGNKTTKNSRHIQIQPKLFYTLCSPTINIFHTQYMEKKCPKMLKYFPFNVFRYSLLSWKCKKTAEYK